MGQGFGALFGASDWSTQGHDISTDPALAEWKTKQDADRTNMLRAASGFQNLNAANMKAVSGAGPSAAENTYMAAAQDAEKRQLGVAQSGNVAPGQRAAMISAAAQNTGTQAGTAANQAGIIRANEMNQARSQAATSIGGMNQAVGNIGQLTVAEAGHDQQAKMQADELNQKTSAENAAALGKIGGGVMSAAGSLAMMSDLRSKDEIVPLFGSKQETVPLFGESNPNGQMKNGVWQPTDAQKDAVIQQHAARQDVLMSDEDTKEDLLRLATTKGSKEGLAPLVPYQYRYKPEVAKEIGEDTALRTGIMAQDMEKSPYLHDVVEEDPISGRKFLDMHRLVSGTAAATAGLDKRLKLLEAAAGKRSAHQ
jgi:hypothetical protein